MFSELGLGPNVGIFVAASAVIAAVGTRLAALADRIADRTGMGEAITGALLLGASTSLPGITASITAAWQGRPELAMSNAVGGIAAQTVFLVVADICNREANLEHQAASVPNILNGTLLTILLGGLMLAVNSSPWTVAHIHPATPLLLGGYVGGLLLVRRSRKAPQWHPRETEETRTDEPEPTPPDEESVGLLLAKFAAYAGIMGLAGWCVAETGGAIVDETGISQSVVGALFIAVATSTPELVTAVAAVRRGALTLAVGDIIGGNAFDVLFAAAADAAYLKGSIYHAISNRERFLMAMSIVMSGILVMGLVSREKRGIANIGFESFLILLIYAGGMAVIAFGTF